MNIILFGGSFDPIHLGHINMARIASETFDADVIFIPSQISIWKHESAPIEHKIKMIEKSIKNYPRFSYSTFEVSSGKKENYSIDTVKYFKKIYPDDNIHYLIGLDQVNEFHRWKDALLLSSLAQIIYFSRPSVTINNDNVILFKMKPIFGEEMNVSSSEIRSLKKLNVDMGVRKYIEENKLYYIKNISSYISERRLKHSISVANLAYDIATKNNKNNADDYYIAGLLHDIGKHQDDKQLMNEIFPKFINLPKYAYHQFIGSFFAKKDFGITNDGILNAIMYHCTGNDDMNDLAKVIYAADKLDPLRGYDSKLMIEKMYTNIDEGFKYALKKNKEYIESKSTEPKNELTSKCFSKYLK